MKILERSIPRIQGVSLIESMIAIAALSIIAAVSYLAATNIGSMSDRTRFERDIITLNAAVRTYIATGGNLSMAKTDAEVIARLKQSLSTETRQTQVGSGGSLIDSRLKPILVAANEATGHARAAWNPDLQRFEILGDGKPGFTGFDFSDENEETLAHDSDRRSSFAFDKPGGWIWPVAPDQAPDRMELTQLNPGQGYGGPGGFNPVVPTRLKLNPPTFSLQVTLAPLTTFPLVVTISDTNPTGTSMPLTAVNSNPLKKNLLGQVTLNPGDRLRGLAVTLDPDNWLDSDDVSNTYDVTPHSLSLALGTTSTAVTYAQVGGDMIGAPLLDLSDIAPTLAIDNVHGQISYRYLNSKSLQIHWLTGDSDPITDPAAFKLPTFKTSVPTQEVNVSLPVWGAATSLRVRAAAVAVKADLFADSPVQETTLTISPTDLRPPLITAHSSNPSAPNEYSNIHLDFDSSFGDTPVGARIYYTLDGSDPGPEAPSDNATLYTTPFKVERDLCSARTIRARVYPPLSHPQWFRTSPESTMVRPPKSEISPTYAWLCDLASNGLCEFSWLVLANDLDVNSAGGTIHGKVGVGPGATLRWNIPPGSAEFVVDPSATLTNPVPNPTVRDLSAPELAAIGINAQGLDLAPTQTFTSINTSGVINATATDGANVISVGDISLKGPDVLVIKGAPEDYFVINVSSKIDIAGMARIEFDGVPADHVVLNVHPGANIKFAGLSLIFGATVISPMASVEVVGEALLTGSVVSGGNSKLAGNGNVTGETAFACSQPK